MKFLISKIPRFDPFYFIIAAIAVLFLFLGKSIYYGNIGIDSWMYFGYYNDYPQYIKLFPYSWTYYHGRLGHILPGYIFFQLFSPMIAGVMYHMLFFIIFISGFYLVVKNNLGKRTSIVFTLILMIYPFSILAFSDDYPAFSALTYSVITVFFVLKAYYSDTSEPRKKRLALFFAGLFGALMIHSQLLVIVYMTGFFMMLFAVYYIRNKFCGIIRDFIFCFCGFLTITILLGVINYYIGGDFLFFIRTIQFSPISNTASTNSHWMPLFISRFFWTFNFIYFVFAFLSLIYLIKHRQNLSPLKIGIYSGIAVNSILVMIFSFISYTTLAMDFNAALLIPQFFLVFACLSSDIINKLPQSKFIIFGVSVVLASLLGGIFIPSVVKIAFGNTFALYPDKNYILPLIIYNIFVLIGLSPILFYKKLFFILLIPLSVFFLDLSKSKYLDLLNILRYKDIILMHNEVKKFDPSGYTFFWYDVSSNTPAMFLTSIYLYNYRTAGYKFPLIGYSSAGGSSDNTVFSSQKICVILNGKDLQENTLKIARKSLNQYGYDFDILGESSIVLNGNYATDQKLCDELQKQRFYFIKVKNIYLPEELKNKKTLFSCDTSNFEKYFLKVGYGYKLRIDKLFPNAITKKSEILYYNPIIINDYLVTDFYEMPENASEIVIEVMYDKNNLPSELLDIRIQDGNYNTVSEIFGKYIFTPESKSYYQVFKIPPTVKKIRMYLISRNASASFLPTVIKLSAGNIENNSRE